MAFFIAIGSSISFAPPASAETGGYPYASYYGPGTDPAQSWWTNSSGGGYSGYGYAYRNCTDYVAWKLQSLGVADVKTRGLGHGKEWATKAQGRSGVTVNGTPAYGAAAVKTDGSYGHVAFVQSVNSNGTITVSEYNWSWPLNGSYGTRTGTASALGFASFVHFGLSSSMPAPPSSGGWNGVGNATFLGASKLVADQKMYKNQYIMSPAGRYVLTLQSDGNLVLYSGTRALWASGTGGQNVDHVKVQSDGNMVMYGSQGGVWGTNTAGQGGTATALYVQDDGNVVMYNGTAGAIWGTNTFVANTSYSNIGVNSLVVEQRLYKNQYLTSPDKRYTLMLQSDGNFILYAPGYKPLWASGTSSQNVDHVKVQSDGNMVMYGSQGGVWGTNTAGQGGTATVLRVQNDGNVVLYNGTAGAIWGTNTAGRLS